MFWTVTLLCWGLGWYLGFRGVRTHFRRRFSRAQFGRWAVRRNRALLGLSAFLLICPEVPALLFTLDSSTAGLAWILRIFALSFSSVVLLAMLLTSRRVTALARAGADEAALKLPSFEGARTRRRLAAHDTRLADFPRGWDDLIEYDRQLSRRLLAYDHDLELSASYPVMRDYTEPRTKAALQAMFECDRLQTATPPPLTRDIVTTGYGKAVARFAQALAEAEAHASSTVQAGVGDAERARLNEAISILAFIDTHTTTAAEREDAYRSVRDLLTPRASGDQTVGSADAPPVASPPVAPQANPVPSQANPVPSQAQPERSHPWLTVRERASLHRMSSRS